MARVAIPATQNLILRSEEFDHASWTKQNSTVTANQDTAPDGALTMDKFIPDAGVATHWMYQLILTTTRIIDLTVSVYAKASGYNWLGLGYGSQAVATGAFFDLQNGVLGTVTAGTVATMESMGNGVYRCSITRNILPGDTKYVSIEAHTADNEGFSFNADGTSGILVWGAQATIANWNGPYVQTVGSTVNTGYLRNKPSVLQNLLTYSEQFDNAAWTKAFTTITPNAAVNPVDGLTTADQMFETADTNNHQIYRGVTLGRKGSTMTLSVYVKDNNRQYMCLGAADEIGLAPQATFDLVNGTITNTSAASVGYIDSSIVSAGNGWYRCSLTFRRTNVFNYCQIYMNNAGGAIASFAGDTGKSIYIFGEQLTEADWVSPYVQTVASSVNNGNLRNKSSVLQNLLTYSEQFDNAAWTKQAGVVVTANQAANPIDGAMTADLIDLTAAAGSAGLYQFVGGNNGRINTKSVWLKGVIGTEVVVLTDPAAAGGF